MRVTQPATCFVSMFVRVVNANLTQVSIWPNDSVGPGGSDERDD